jgi:hypothetical protein
MNIDEYYDRLADQYDRNNNWDPPTEYVCNTCGQCFDSGQTEGKMNECYYCQSDDVEEA